MSKVLRALRIPIPLILLTVTGLVALEPSGLGLMFFEILAVPLPHLPGWCRYVDHAWLTPTGVALVGGAWALFLGIVGCLGVAMQKRLSINAL